MPVKVLVLLVWLVGCAGSPAESKHSPSDAATSRLPAPRDGGVQTDSSEPPSATPSVSDAMPISWDGRVPQNHRASPAQCPPERAAGSPCPDGGVPSPTNFACMQDSDCTVGLNGRCLSVPQLVTPSPPSQGTQGLLYCETVCSYDQCLSDLDCPVRTPCACRFPSIYGSPNVCLTASNCAIDADCGRGAFCSPSAVVGQADRAYFCHTSNDLCIDDADCSPPAMGGQALCEFDAGSGHWSCHRLPSRL
jgi:hypothetical protein